MYSSFLTKTGNSKPRHAATCALSSVIFSQFFHLAPFIYFFLSGMEFCLRIPSIKHYSAIVRGVRTVILIKVRESYKNFSMWGNCVWRPKVHSKCLGATGMQDFLWTTSILLQLILQFRRHEQNLAHYVQHNEQESMVLFNILPWIVYVRNSHH